MVLVGGCHSQSEIFLLLIVLGSMSYVSGFLRPCIQMPLTIMSRSSRGVRAYPSISLGQGSTISTTLAAKTDKEEDIFSWDPASGEDPIIIRGTDADDIDGSIWEDLETGQPPKWLVMKELLGINVFTYILAALIVFFLSMNYFAGPGWLGSLVGVPGTGSFTETSESFPDTVDLSSPEFRL